MAKDFILNTAQGAPLWRRFASMMYDSFLLLALSMGYGGLATVTLFLIQGDSTGGQYQPMVTTTLGNIALLLGWVATLMGFYIFFWRRAGQTAGMRAWRLEVIRSKNAEQMLHPTLKESSLRAPLSVAAFILGGIGFWWRWFDNNGDCLHDKLSHTRVIVTPPRKKKR